MPLTTGTLGNFPNLDLAPDGKRFVVFPLPEGGAHKRSLHVTSLPMGD